MPERRKLTTLDKLNIMARQARCPLCDKKLGTLEATEFDHEHALCLGGPDDLDNLRAVHRTCHDRKTNGPGGERRITTAGSDKHTAAKTDRLAEAHADLVEARTVLSDRDLAEPETKPAPRQRPSSFPPAARRGRASAGVNKPFWPDRERPR